MGFFCAGFILSIVVAKEVNPLRLSGIAMGNNNTSGFLGSAVLQVVMGKVLDTRWDGVLLGGARVYPLHAYRTAFLVCFGVEPPWRPWKHSPNGDAMQGPRDVRQ